MYVLRCVIDFIGLSDMLDSECDMTLTPIKWEELPHLPAGHSDIKGTLNDKTLWLQTMVGHTVHVLVMIIIHVLHTMYCTCTY